MLYRAYCHTPILFCQPSVKYNALSQKALLPYPYQLLYNARYQTAVNDSGPPLLLNPTAPLPITVLYQDEFASIRAPLPITVSVVFFDPPRPTVTPLIVASAVVTRFPLAPERRNDSILFLLNTRSWLSVVPMNCVSGLVPALPVRAHPAPAHPAGCHVAIPPLIVST